MMPITGSIIYLNQFCKRCSPLCQTEPVSTKRSMKNYRIIERLNSGDETVDMHYLYCNEHFLLGLSNVAESVLKREVKAYEDEVGYSIGRDALSKFRKFSSGESGPARYVRLACDILGMGEDEKNGCRMDWEGYGSKIDKKSSVTSFRMNRFNNFFEGAAALCYHRNDIIDFLTNFKPKEKSARENEGSLQVYS